eukprot:IDg6374t1
MQRTSTSKLLARYYQTTANFVTFNVAQVNCRIRNYVRLGVSIKGISNLDRYSNLLLQQGGCRHLSNVHFALTFRCSAYPLLQSRTTAVLHY